MLSCWHDLLFIFCLLLFYLLLLPSMGWLCGVGFFGLTECSHSLPALHSRLQITILIIIIITTVYVTQPKTVCAYILENTITIRELLYVCEFLNGCNTLCYTSARQSIKHITTGRIRNLYNMYVRSQHSTTGRIMYLMTNIWQHHRAPRFSLSYTLYPTVWSMLPDQP